MSFDVFLCVHAEMFITYWEQWHEVWHTANYTTWWKAIASSISFLTEASTPSTGPLPCPDSVKTQLTWMLFSTANRLVKKALYLLWYCLVGLSDITYKYFSCSKLNDLRTFSKDAQTAGALLDFTSDIVP